MCRQACVIARARFWGDQPLPLRFGYTEHVRQRYFVIVELIHSLLKLALWATLLVAVSDGSLSGLFIVAVLLMAWQVPRFLCWLCANGSDTYPRRQSSIEPPHKETTGRCPPP